MLKILLKAAVLLLIVISVYLIVNPTACSNMLAGRERTDIEYGPGAEWRHPMAEPQDELSRPTSRPQTNDELLDESNTPTDSTAQRPVENASDMTYSQADIDYAMASRYVELEREYVKEGRPLGKDTSREISFIVMDEYQMSPTEWENFLVRATASGLFDKARRDLPNVSAE